jgi:hypothetical protein
MRVDPDRLAVPTKAYILKAESNFVKFRIEDRIYTD